MNDANEDYRIGTDPRDIDLFRDEPISDLDLQLGRRFGRLTVVDGGLSKGGRRAVRVKCECGTLKIIRESSLLSGKSKSCGCLQKELAREKKTTHGLKRTTEYTIWSSMKQAAVDACQGHIWGKIHVSKIDYSKSSSAACIRCGERRAWTELTNE